MQDRKGKTGYKYFIVRERRLGCLKSSKPLNHGSTALQ